MLNSRLVDEAVNKSGGRKKELQRMVLNGHIDQLTATIAAMRIDRIQNAAKADQLAQPTVAEQVLNPQPQMSPQGVAAAPQARQMPPQAQMGQPSPQAMMAARGGMLTIPYDEGNYAEGGIVGFNAGGGYGEAMAQLRRQLGAARTQAQRDEITSAMNQLEAQYQKSTYQPSLAAADLSTPTAQITGGNRFNTGTLTEAEARRIEGAPPPVDLDMGMETYADSDLTSGVQQGASLFSQLKNATPAPVPGEDARAARKAASVTGPATKINTGIDPDIAGLVGLNANQAIVPEEKPAAPLNEAQLAMQADKMRAAKRRANAPGLGRNVIGSPEYIRAQGGADMNALDRMSAENEGSGGIMGLLNQGIRSVVDAGKESNIGATVRDVISSPIDFIRGKGEELGRAVSERDRSAAGAAEAEANLKAIQEQVAQTEKESKAMAGNQDDVLARARATSAAENKQMTGTIPTTKGDTAASAASENANVQELANAGVSGETLTTIGSLTDMFNKEEGAAAKKYREYLQNLPKQAGQRKSDALAMFALQTGIGMLAQPGGQTALQAAGKSANNAMKTYVAEMKDIRGLEEKALKGEVALEELQQKRADANLKIAADIYGRQLVADTSLAAARINAGKPTDATRGINRFVTAIKEKVANGEMRPMSDAQIRLKAQNDYYGLLAEVQAAKVAQSGVKDQAYIFNLMQTTAQNAADSRFAALKGTKDFFKLDQAGVEALQNRLFNEEMARQRNSALGQLYLQGSRGSGTTGNPLVDKYLN